MKIPIISLFFPLGEVICEDTFSYCPADNDVCDTINWPQHPIPPFWFDIALEGHGTGLRGMENIDTVIHYSDNKKRNKNVAML